MCLMFEMKDEGESDPHKLAQMMQSLGVFISVKPKAKQAAKVIHYHSSLMSTLSMWSLIIQKICLGQIFVASLTRILQPDNAFLTF